MKKILLLVFLCCCACCVPVGAQVPDSIKKEQSVHIITDSVAPPAIVKKKFEPRKATIRSAILPGWGQIYNKKYWKLPLVWGALGTTAGIYFYNVKNYNLLKQAYIYRVNGQDDLVDPDYRNLSTESIRSYRNSFRQNVDYSVLFFVLFWGLNVVDATVDAHLKSFDVDDNLSLEIKPGYSPMANTSGISLVLNIGRHTAVK